MSLRQSISLGERDRLMRPQGWAIEQVPPGDAAAPWRRCWELLERAVERFPVREKFTSESLLYDVMSGNAQLWVAWSYERKHIEGAVITRLFDKPKLAPNEKVCEIPLVAGDNLAEWGAPMMAILKAFALNERCDFLAGYGRKGWKRLYGFREAGKDADGLPILVLPLKEH